MTSYYTTMNAIFAALVVLMIIVMGAILVQSYALSYGDVTTITVDGKSSCVVDSQTVNSVYSNGLQYPVKYKDTFEDLHMGNTYDVRLIIPVPIMYPEDKYANTIVSIVTSPCQSVP